DVVASYHGAPVRGERGETTAEQDLPVRLHRDALDKIARIRIKRIRQAGTRIKPRDVVACLPADAVEKAACENLAVRLERDAADIAVRLRIKRIYPARHWVESRYVRP